MLSDNGGGGKQIIFCFDVIMVEQSLLICLYGKDRQGCRFIGRAILTVIVPQNRIQYAAIFACRMEATT